MSNLLNATDQIKAWANKNRAILVLAEELERIGSVEQAAADAVRAHTAAKSKLTSIRNQVVDAEKQLREADESLTKFATIGNELIKDAKEEAESIIKAAQENAAQVQAKSEANAVAASHAADAVKKELKVAVDKLNAEVASVEARVIELYKEESDVVERIEAAKESARVAFRGFTG